MITGTATCETSSRGFTLVELLVAMVISLIITIGVVQIFSANRATYQLDEGLARAQENGRFAMEFLAQDIRHAGYFGCNRDIRRVGPSQLDPFKPFSFLVGSQRYTPRGVNGFEYTTAPGTGIGITYPAGAFPINNAAAGWGPALNTALVPGSDGNPGAQPGTDVIAVEHLLTTPLPLVAPYVDINNVYIDPGSVSKVKIGDIMLISDCREAAIFQVTGISAAGAISHVTGMGTPGNRCEQWEAAPFASTNAANVDCSNLFENPQPNLVVGVLQTTVFYVARGPGPCTNPGTCQPTLFRNVTDPSGVPNPQALVEGVESMQVLYGVDDVNPDGVADRYVTANQVPDFSLVTSVRIGLLVHGTNATGSINNASLDTDTYNVAGTFINPTDDQLRRRVFTSTFQLRNRGF